MLSKEENDLLCRVGPGTPMGELMRRYWLPALLSHELPQPDCPPVRVRLLGERLIAFRDTENRIGLLDEFCAHRGVSLWLGRNEECGIRCVFHGWKYDVDGNCTDMMNEVGGGSGAPDPYKPAPDPNQPGSVGARRASPSFKDKIHLTSYPTVEMGGIIWAYMGPKEKVPPEPKFECTQVPQSQREVTKTWEECNWLQSLEGGIDTSHAPILHRTFSDVSTQSGIGPSNFRVRGGAPRLEVEVTDYGYRYAGIRSLGEEGDYVRAYHFVMPFTQIRANQYQFPSKAWRPRIHGHFWVPMDDENCMVYNWLYNFGDEPLPDADRAQKNEGNSFEDVDMSRGFRKVRNMDNNWLIDRDVQKHSSFTGIYGINTQDHAVQESMGPIQDRTKEHLGPADKAIITARQLLLKAVRTVEDGGNALGADTSYYNIRAIERVIPRGAQWSEALHDELYPEPTLAH